MKSLLHRFHSIDSNDIFPQSQEVVLIFAKPPIFLFVTPDDFFFAMPVLAIAFKNQVTFRQIKINQPRTYLFLGFKWLIEIYQRLRYYPRIVLRISIPSNLRGY